jgi:predicted transcriptional regulator
MLERPTTVYDIVTELGYANSTAHKMLKDYLNQGIVYVETRRVKFGFGIKKLYRLTDLGLELLRILEKLAENKNLQKF